MLEYAIPAGSVILSQEIKKSRFLTYLSHANCVEVAKEVIQKIRIEHPTARHHCWGFIAGAPNDTQVLGFSDDGEPNGTAGKPILSQLQGSRLGEVIAVVVRYYGGILLGTGGLVKAYGGGVQQALKILPTKMRIPEKKYLLKCEYHQLSLIESLFQQYKISIEHIEYVENVILTVNIPCSVTETIQVKLRDVSRGLLLLLPLEQ